MNAIEDIEVDDDTLTLIAIEVTRLVKDGGPLTKAMHPNADGTVTNDSSQCRMPNGVAHRALFADWRDFASAIEATPPDTAWTTGALRAGLPATVRIVVKKKVRKGSSSISRTADNFLYREGEPALALLDYDDKGMPAAVRERLKELGGFVAAIVSLCPDFALAGHIRRRSTSAGVVNSETGAEYLSTGEHVYLLVKDGADIPRFLQALHNRAWLAGLGWYMVGKAGQLLERSTVDKSVGSPERLNFEAKADLDPPLEQRPRRATVHDGQPLDTRLACPDPTAEEKATLQRLKAVAAHALKRPAEAARTIFIEEKVKDAVKRGEDPQRARATAEGWSRGELRPGVTLEFDDPEIGTKTVADVLADPESYIGEALADPIEGVTYGQQTAKVLRRSTGEIFINSFAHGGAFYRFIPNEADEGVSVDDFYAYMPLHNYIFAPTRMVWPASSVNARLPPIPMAGGGKALSANTWLDQNKAVEQMTWSPGDPMLIRDRLIAERGWIDRKGVACFNLYRPPMISFGIAENIDFWLNHWQTIYPADADHILKWCAHRVQRPQEKINHAIVLGGKPGIGKDSMLEPVRLAIGPWNFGEASPKQVLDRFNGFLKSVILRISEARDLGEYDRFAFYDHMKPMLAAPPDTLRVDEKHVPEHSIPNCLSVIITTNHKTDGIYLPPDDRRHYVAWGLKEMGDFEPDYWNALWGSYQDGGFARIAAYLNELDISDFDPKAPPLKTDAFWAIADAGRPPEDAEMADVLDALGTPAVVTLESLRDMAKTKKMFEFEIWLGDRRNRRVIPHRLEKCGYAPVRNETAKDGQYAINGTRQAVYVRDGLSIQERHNAVNRFLAASQPDTVVPFKRERE
jgi:hypothetical protein